MLEGRGLLAAATLGVGILAVHFVPPKLLHRQGLHRAAGGLVMLEVALISVLPQDAFEVTAHSTQTAGCTAQYLHD